MGAFIDNEAWDGPRPSPPPYSHATGYEACERTDLVAGSDVRLEVLEQFGSRYDVPPKRRYVDYKQMILEQRPDIVSVATQPEQRTESIMFAIEHGVRAIYAEKPLCASLAEAEVIRRACLAHGVHLNMGTKRRWHPGYAAMRRLIESREYGALKTLMIYKNGTLFNTSSHWYDLVMWLNGDSPVEWVQAYLPKGDALIAGDDVREDPSAQASFAFANGVMTHALLSPHPSNIQAMCEGAIISSFGGGVRFEVQTIMGPSQNRGLDVVPFPAYEDKSMILCLVEDLVHSLDTGEPPRGGVQVAYDNTQLLFGCIESHLRAGARVPLPLENHRLRFARPDLRAQQPTYV
jgi:predicted dehydrogenase